MLASPGAAHSVGPVIYCGHAPSQPEAQLTNQEQRRESAPPRCTEAARRLGEQPIGSAPIWTRCLVVELAPPWDPKVEFSKAFPAPLRELLQRLDVEGERVRLQCVLPDPDYSATGMSRLMLFSRPEGAFVTNDRVEYVVPDELVVQFASSLLEDDSDLGEFAPFKEPDRRTRDIMVCTHGNRDACCGSFGVPVYEDLRKMTAPYGSGSETAVRVWRTSHTGGHRFAPTLIDMPDGRYWAGVDAELARAILIRDSDVEALADRYRGWAALKTCAEQNAEKAVFARVGWDWLDAEKRVKTIDRDPGNDRHRVRFEYARQGDERTESLEIAVEFTGTVPSMNCMKAGAKGDNPQYRVVV